MFFTKTARIAAWFLFVMAAFRVVMGFLIAFGGDRAMAQQYLGSRTTGEAIDQGFLWLLVAIGLGVAAEISRSVAAKSND